MTQQKELSPWCKQKVVEKGLVLLYLPACDSDRMRNLDLTDGARRRKHILKVIPGNTPPVSVSCDLCCDAKHIRISMSAGF